MERNNNVFFLNRIIMILLQFRIVVDSFLNMTMVWIILWRMLQTMAMIHRLHSTTKLFLKLYVLVCCWSYDSFYSLPFWIIPLHALQFFFPSTYMHTYLHTYSFIYTACRDTIHAQESKVNCMVTTWQIIHDFGSTAVCHRHFAQLFGQIYQVCIIYSKAKPMEISTRSRWTRRRGMDS